MAHSAAQIVRVSVKHPSGFQANQPEQMQDKFKLLPLISHTVSLGCIVNLFGNAQDWVKSVERSLENHRTRLPAELPQRFVIEFHHVERLSPRLVQYAALFPDAAVLG